jgi:hypothetical protein
MMTTSVIAAFLAVLALATGCEDSGLTAAKDDQMYLVALPPNVPFDENGMASQIVATIVSSTGAPRKGVQVFFSCDGGTLDSQGQPVSTDSSGHAYDLLKLQPDGPGSISVIATSTSLTKTVTVTNGACASNTAPTAEFPAPTNPAAGHTGDTATVNLNGGASADTGGNIVSYEWTCGNLTSGGNTSSGTCEYTVGAAKAVYTITLTVKDNGLGGEAPYTCQKSATISHPVTIDVLPATP